MQQKLYNYQLLFFKQLSILFNNLQKNYEFNYNFQTIFNLNAGGNYNVNTLINTIKCRFFK